jgi:hypothetical protein
MLSNLGQITEPLDFGPPEAIPSSGCLGSKTSVRRPMRGERAA